MVYVIMILALIVFVLAWIIAWGYIRYKALKYRVQAQADIIRSKAVFIGNEEFKAVDMAVDMGLYRALKLPTVEIKSRYRTVEENKLKAGGKL